eukprot:3911993-Ditylum_brightwellii.AAC.1
MDGIPPEGIVESRNATGVTSGSVHVSGGGGEHKMAKSFKTEEPQGSKEEKKDVMYDDDDQSYDFNK